MTAPLVVGYTATPAGRDAIAVASRLATALGAPLRVVMVTPSVGRNAQVPPQDGYGDVVREQSRGWLREATSHIPEGIEHSAHVRPSASFPEGLIEAAEEFAASHIVVGAANGGRRGRHRLGSVATALLHSAPVPVVLAPAGSAGVTGPITRFTATVGTRPGAGAVIDEAVELASETGASLRLVSVVATDLPSSVDTKAIDVAAAAHASEVLEQAVQNLPNNNTQVVVATGETIEEAVTSLEWADGEFVLVGSSRLAAPRRLFLGSTAAKMLHELPVPMIVVPRTRNEGN